MVAHEQVILGERICNTQTNIESQLMRLLQVNSMHVLFVILRRLEIFWVLALRFFALALFTMLESFECIMPADVRVSDGSKQDKHSHESRCHHESSHAPT